MQKDIKVSIDANFTLKGVFETPYSMSFQRSSVTLRELLREVDRRVHSVTIFRGDELGDDIEEILLNGKQFFSLEKKLDTSLKNGDTLRIDLYMAPLGGG